MTRTGEHGEKGSKFNFTPEEKKRYLKELSVIYCRCLTGKATDREMKIAEKFSPALIRKLEKDFPMEPTPDDTEEEEKELQEMWKRVTGKLHIDRPLTGHPLTGTGENSTDGDYRKAWEEELKKAEKKRTAPVRILYRYAAVAALIALITGTLLHFGPGLKINPEDSRDATGKVEFQASNEQKNITLEDGSKIELNRESELKVSVAFNENVREVTMKGEVFFDVAKNPEKPFIVKTTVLNVAVRGTSFGVMSYDGIDEKQVTVCSGRVEVSNPQNGQLYAVLTPGTQLIFNSRTGRYEVKKVDAKEATAWREGRLVLNNASVAELRLRVRQYFGKVLVIEDHALPEDTRITSSFNYEEATANNVMDRVCALFGTKYRIQDNRITVYR